MNYFVFYSWNLLDNILGLVGETSIKVKLNNTRPVDSYLTPFPVINLLIRYRATWQEHIRRGIGVQSLTKFPYLKVIPLCIYQYIHATPKLNYYTSLFIHNHFLFLLRHDSPCSELSPAIPFQLAQVTRWTTPLRFQLGLSYLYIFSRTNIQLPM